MATGWETDGGTVTVNEVGLYIEGEFLADKTQHRTEGQTDE